MHLYYFHENDGKAFSISNKSLNTIEDKTLMENQLREHLDQFFGTMINRHVGGEEGLKLTWYFIGVYITKNIITFRTLLHLGSFITFRLFYRRCLSPQRATGIEKYNCYTKEEATL